MDILGQVYERFLGKVIRLTAGHQAKVEEKPEVRKAGGVYYTPTYIVDYIVKQYGLGELLTEKTPEEQKNKPLLRARPGLRFRLVPAGRLPIPAGLVPGLVRPSNEPGKLGQGQIPGGDGGRGRLAVDHWTKKKRNLAQPHLRRGYRRPGGGGDQAVAAAEGAGGREPGPGSFRLFERAHPARSGQQHPVRQFADRPGLL